MKNSSDITILLQWDESEGPWCSKIFVSLWKHMNSLIDLRSAELNRLLHETSGDRCCFHTNYAGTKWLGQVVALLSVNALLYSTFVPTNIISPMAFLYCLVFLYCCLMPEPFTLRTSHWRIMWNNNQKITHQSV